MFPTSFNESNHVLDKPHDMDREQCEALSVWLGELPGDFHNFPVVVSCWKPTKEELEEINRTGRIYLMIYGPSMPPVSLFGENPFDS